MLVPVILAAVLAALVLWTLSDVRSTSDGFAITLVLGVGALLIGGMIASGAGCDVARYPSASIGFMTNAGLVFMVALPLIIVTGLGLVLRRRSTAAAAAFAMSASVILGMLAGALLAHA